MCRVAVMAFLFSSLPAGLMANAQTVVISPGTPNRIGDTLRIPITLSGDPGNEVSAMDFELHYDSHVLRPLGIETGSAAIAAGKDVQANVVAAGEYKVLMFGFNQTTMSEGDVAYVRFRILNEPESGNISLRVANTTVSQTDAAAIPSRGDSLTIKVGDQDQDDEPEDPTDESTEPANTIDSTPETGIPRLAGGGGLEGDAGEKDDAVTPGNSRGEMRRPGDRGAMDRREAVARALREATEGREALPGGGVAGPDDPEGESASEGQNVSGGRSLTVARKIAASGIRDPTGPAEGSSTEIATEDVPLGGVFGENRRGALVAGSIVAALLIAMWLARRKLVT